jgi:OOP family OmpA-OmpF porin
MKMMISFLGNGQVLRAGFVGLSIAAIAACTSNPSRGIDDQGKALEVVFPDPARDAWQVEGTFAKTEALDSVDIGATKDQLYALLGRPHFGEGLAGVREWDYIFHFRTGPLRQIVTCQYKVIFDKHYTVGSVHWKPAGCGNVARDKLAAVSAPMPVRMPATPITP